MVEGVNFLTVALSAVIQTTVNAACVRGLQYLNSILHLNNTRDFSILLCLGVFRTYSHLP